MVFRFLAIVFLCAGIFFVKPAVALTDSQVDNAQDFIVELANEAIDFLADAEITPEQRKTKFDRFLNSKFDIDKIGRFAMGRSWRSATPAQQKAYVKLFNKRLVEVYSRRFSEYNGQTLEIVTSKHQGKQDVIVESLIPQPNGSTVRLDWRVRYEDGRYKVIDVIVEGVSMAVTQRSDFASVIQRGGGDIEVLLAHLDDN